MHDNTIYPPYGADGMPVMQDERRGRGRPRKEDMMRNVMPMSQGLDDTLRVIEQLRADLRSVIDRKALKMVGMMTNRADRCFQLCDIIEKACSIACRWMPYGESAGIYVFDSQKWVPCRDVIFSKAVKLALGDCGVTMGDLSYYEGKLLKAGITGCQLSELNVSPLYVGFSNGVWDFRDVSFPQYHSFGERCEITSVLPYPYLEGADCPRWKHFLKEMLDDKQIEMLQRFLGLGVYPRKLLPYKIENSLWLIGPGGNGKSVISEVVTGVYGRENIGNIDLMGLIKGGDERSWNLAHIEGRLFNYCTEIQADDITKYADQFKSLCSGEPQMARRLRENIHTMTDVPYLIFNMNRKPRFDNQDFASERRLLYIVFRRAVRKEDMNPHLAAELLEELPGIRNWMLEGFRKMMHENYKFTATEQSIQESEEYLIENDQTVAYFLRKNEMRAYMYTREDASHRYAIQASIFYEQYVAFTEANGMQACNMKKFGMELGRLQYRKTRNGMLGMIYNVWCDHEIPYALKN